jgi:hypothetical protein
MWRLVTLLMIPCRRRGENQKKTMQQSAFHLSDDACAVLVIFYLQNAGPPAYLPHLYHLCGQDLPASAIKSVRRNTIFVQIAGKSVCSTCDLAIHMVCSHWSYSIWLR